MSSVCAICSHDLNKQDSFVSGDRSHKTCETSNPFHRTCIINWWSEQREEGVKCPNCRKILPISISIQDCARAAISAVPSTLKTFVARALNTSKDAVGTLIFMRLAQMSVRKWKEGRFDFVPQRFIKEACAAASVAMLASSHITIPMMALEISRTFRASHKNTIYYSFSAISLLVNYLIHKKIKNLFDVQPDTYNASLCAFLMTAMNEWNNTIRLLS